MNAPFQRGAGPRELIVVAVPRWIVIIFSLALILNATTTMMVAVSLIAHVLGGRP